MPQAQTGSVQNLLERMTNADKDFRFMATNDLISELQNENMNWDDEGETRITHQIISLLKDKNGEVQNLAVRCLGFLISKIKDARRQLVISSLCQMLRHETEEIRDISSMALKIIVPEIPINKQMIDIVNSDLNPNLLKAIGNNDDVNVQLETLEILGELINRVGVKLTNYHEVMQKELIRQLSSDRSAVRKRSMNALSNLLACCSDDLFDSTLSQLHQALIDLTQKIATENSEVQVSSTINTTKTLLQCVATIIRFAGHRSNIDQLKEIIPVICTLSKVDDDEVKEHSLQAFESYVKRCPVTISEALPQIIDICLTNISHDPNYNYCDDEDQMDCDGMDFEVDENGDGSDSVEDYSDDDDLSWKVRRASSKCLEAVIIARRDLVNDFFDKIAPVIVARFKEREESVRADIIQTFVTLLRQARSLINESKGAQIQATFSRLQDLVSIVVCKASSLWRDKYIKTRPILFQMFTEIISILPNALSDHISSIIPGVLHSLTDKNSTANMRMDALVFLQELLKMHPPTIFQPRVPDILPPVLAAVSDSFYRIASEALTLLSSLIRVMRPPGCEPMAGCDAIFPCIYEKILDRISQQGVDTEVKERAINCMGDLIAIFGDMMHQQTPIVMDIIYEKLNSETNRLTSVKALTKVVNSTLNIPLDCIFPKALPLLSTFLKKNSRQLRVTTLILIDCVIKRCPDLLDANSVRLLLDYTPSLINENDLHVSQLALNMLTSILQIGKADLQTISQDIVPEALKLARSPLLQGSALQAVLNFFSHIAASPLPGLSHPNLLAKLVEPIYNGQSLHKQIYNSTAKIIAAISHDDSKAMYTIEKLINDSTKQENHPALIIILLSLGEIGKKKDLGDVPQLVEVLLGALSSPSEEVKLAGSYALGCVAVGSSEKFLPIILQEIEAKNKRQYLILHSLREVISYGRIDAWESIWQLLMKHCECPEEGTRNVVSECLGKMIFQDPSVLLQRLIKHFKEDFSDKPLARSTVVAAIKFTISDQPNPIDDLLRHCLSEYLLALRDTDIEVRRSALVLFNSAAHNKPSLIVDLLPSTLPLLYEDTVVKPELIRMVEMGPFKHQVDDGLDSRKAAFECMYTLLDNCQSHLDMMEFLTYVEKGLKDHYDIKMLTYLMLNKLAALCPSAVLQRMDQLIRPIDEVCRSRPKDNAVKQEHERQDELKRSALKAFDTLRSIPDAERHPAIVNFNEDLIKNNKPLADLYISIHRDSTVPNLDPANRMDVG